MLRRRLLAVCCCMLLHDKLCTTAVAYEKWTVVCCARMQELDDRMRGRILRVPGMQDAESGLGAERNGRNGIGRRRIPNRVQVQMKMENSAICHLLSAICDSSFLVPSSWLLSFLTPSIRYCRAYGVHYIRSI